MHSTDWTPRHWNQHSALHRLDQRNSLVHCVSPAFDAPALLSADLALFQVRKLPQVVDRVQLANLHEPCSDAFHNLAACLESTTPMCLPFEEIAWVKRVGSQLEDTAELAWRGGGPERELLHKGSALSSDE